MRKDRGLATRTTHNRDWVGLAAVLSVAVVLRAAWVLYATRVPVGLHDPTFYLVYAGQIADGEGYRLLDGQPTAYYPVGYPGALGLVFWLVRHTPIPDDPALTAAWFNVALGTATVALVWVIGRRLFGPPVALAAAAITALWPNLIFHSAVALTETLFNFLVMAALALLLTGKELNGAPSRRRLVAFGVLLGLSALVRPISLLLLPLLLIAWGRRAWPSLVLVAATTAGVILPWTVRNVIVMDAPVLISTNLGDNLCIGRHPGATGAFRFDDYCFAGYDQYERPEYEIRRNDGATRQAFDYLLDHPLEELELVLWRAFYTVQHDHDGIDAAESYGDDPFIPARGRELATAVADGWFFAVGALAICSLPAFLRGRDRRPLFVLSAGCALAATPLVFFGDARFHLPAIPFLALGAAVTLMGLVGRSSR